MEVIASTMKTNWDGISIREKRNLELVVITIKIAGIGRETWN